MVRFILRRILTFIPSLILISWILFTLSKCTPGDPVAKLLGVQNPMEDVQNRELYLRRYQQTALRLHLDEPNFYFAIAPKGYPDTLWQLYDPQVREWYRQMLHSYGHFDSIEELYKVRSQLILAAGQCSKGLEAQEKIELIQVLRNFERHTQPEEWSQGLYRIGSSCADSITQIRLGQFEQAMRSLVSHSQSLNLMPSFRWFGSNNQYHRWFAGMLAGDFGMSYRDGRSSSVKIWEALRWTLSLNGISILLAYFISIPLGIFIGALASPRIAAWLQGGLYVLYAIPVFWLATLLVMFFTSTEYGSWLHWFPTVGVIESYSGDGFWTRFFQSFSRLLLPIICLILSLISVLTRQMTQSVRQELRKPYLLTIQAKGIPRKRMVWKHLLPNSLFPIITLFSNALPFAIVGSVTIEYIFNIPGMGRLMLESVQYQDWSVVFTISLLISGVTLLGLLLSDILYMLLDPRVSVDKSIRS